MSGSIRSLLEAILMSSHDPRVDAYISKAADFAQPVLIHFRELVHQACPDVVETIKWGMPAFDYKGPLCGMAAFKQHCVIGFWKASILFAGPDSASSKSDVDVKKMNWGTPGRDPIPAKITCIEELPSKNAILKLIKKAKKLNDDGVKIVRSKTKKPPLTVPKDLLVALKTNKPAAEVFKAFSPSQQREYIEWILDAKKDETRQRRIATTIEQLGEDKTRNWKYERK